MIEEGAVLKKDTATGRKTRDMNVELLRIILMLMVVTLHYLSHGGILDATPLGGSHDIFIWGLETLSFIGVDGFVIISGYYMSDSDFKLKKLFSLVLQIVFTSIVIYLLFAVLGLAPFTRYDTFGAFFPIITGKYWFVTSYVCLYCLTPFLNAVVRNVTKRQLQALVILLSLMFCSWRAFFSPLTMMNTDGGYNVVWLVCLYFFAAYLRLYWDFKINKWIYLAVYFLCCGFVLWNKCQGNDDFLAYISVPITTAAIALFLFFREVKINSSVWSRIIGFISPLTFGVYLISENIWLRSILYTKILQTQLFIGTPQIVYAIPMSILAIFFGCILIDFVRSILFRPLLSSMLFQDICGKIEDKMAA